MAKVTNVVRAAPVESITLYLTGKEAEALNAMGLGIHPDNAREIGIYYYEKHFSGTVQELRETLYGIGAVIRNELEKENLLMGRLSGMKGGGFLNNVDGTFLGYTITDAFPGTTADPEDPQVFAVLTIQPDGADAPVETTLRGGSGAYLAIQDEHTLVNPEGGTARIWDKSDLYHFLESVEKAGVADGGIDESDPSSLSFTSLIGRRMRFAQERDEARMAARAKSGQNPNRVVKQDDGTTKEYPYTRLVVEAVYDGQVTPTAPAVAAPARVANGAAKPVGRGATAGARAASPVVAAGRKGAGTAASTPFARGGKPNGVAASATAEGDLDIETTAKLKAILDADGGQVLRSDLTRLATTLLLAERNPRREVIRKRMYAPEFLASVDGVVFDEVGQTVALA